VTDKSQALVATLLGAVVGGAAGYLIFTDRGRSLRRQIEPALEDIARELSSFLATAQKAAGVASDGWKLVSETIGEVGQTPRFSGTRQTAPF
jgi:gas vesicle protein